MDQPQLATRTTLTSQTGLEDLIPDLTDDTISFAGGLPDPAQFPKQAISDSFQRVLANNGLDALQYHNAKGYLPLREQLAERLDQENYQVNADQILLTQGAQQGLDLVAKLLLNKGDHVIVEAPTYVGALAAFAAYEPHYHEIPLESDGMDLVQLNKVLLTQKIKIIYTVPNFQNPTGIVMSLAKRQQLIELANRYNVIILEDDPYHYLRFVGETLPSLKSLDTQGRVISLGSFSKILAPGLRIGWLLAAEPLLKQIRYLKDGADLESPTLTQQVISDYLLHNDFDAHLEVLRKDYLQKRNWMLAALKQYLPAGFSYTQPEGGFFLWLTGPADLNFEKLLREQIAPQEHLLYVPSTHLYASNSVLNSARISYATYDQATIDLGVSKLSQALAREVSHSRAQ
ncbi:PLP-dependent aminotransferase family protein [Lapidilactobacillus mulanensis]|uniref:PLP-dependent aminotransferase family protein n=1 Tax=Lapidilactobacillus mulanensis TaxID=2485999 RepID=A0ABW4DMT4_9LACO|nr:PLP-dependent aminotransferase family protein [Lapidilactobacillus mulanensis]